MTHMKVTSIERLVRDKIPEMLRAKGMIVHDRVMGQAEYHQRLKDKIVRKLMRWPMRRPWRRSQKNLPM